MNINLKDMKFGGKLLPVAVALLGCLASTAPASAADAPPPTSPTPPVAPVPPRAAEDMLTINDGKGTQISFTASDQGQEFFTTPTAGIAPAGFTGRTVFLIGAYDEARVGSNLTSLGGFNLPSNWNVSDALTIRPSSDGKLDVSFISDGASAAEARSFPVWNSATGGLITGAGDLSGTGGPLFIGETGGQQDLSSVFGLAPGSIMVASAVPEPETYAMLLAGLGLMGAVVRRRSMPKT